MKCHFDVNTFACVSYYPAYVAGSPLIMLATDSQHNNSAFISTISYSIHFISVSFTSFSVCTIFCCWWSNSICCRYQFSHPNVINLFLILFFGAVRSISRSHPLCMPDGQQTFVSHHVISHLSNHGHGCREMSRQMARTHFALPTNSYKWCPEWQRFPSWLLERDAVLNIAKTSWSQSN